MAAFTYPGVYIEELSSGQHTITGVATSIGAFIGWAAMGPVDAATLVQSWAEFQTIFGGLDSRSWLGYSVNQFFANGGGECYIVRLAWDGTLTGTHSPTANATASATGIGGSLTLYAANPGLWGNSLRVSVTIPTGSTTTFNLLVQMLNASGALTTLESYVNLSISATDANYAVTVVNSDSSYVTFTNPSTAADAIPAALPTATASAEAFTGGLDGTVLVPNDGNFELALAQSATRGYLLLDRVDIFNLLCVPGETTAANISTLQAYCMTRRAFYLVDSPKAATISGLITSGPVGSTSGSITGVNANYSAFYFPWVQAPDPVVGNRPALFPPCGFVAGIYAATDASRGVWKAPAGIQASITGNSGLQYVMTEAENGSLNTQAVNCIRQFKVYGDVVWGARTLDGNDQQGSQWKYVPIRRLALFIESSLYNGTQWVVFEPNDATLWGQVRMNVGTFMQGLFLQGAFAGTTPQTAYFVKCDAENNPGSSVAQGIVNILVGFAPVSPAEFVVIQIQQILAN
jgi:phage tail sheath protein FI